MGMALLDKNLYVLVMEKPMLISKIKTQILFRNASNSRMGRITQAGLIRNSMGVSPWRIFGQYALVYLLDGSGRYCDANGADQTICPGDFILVFPKLGHRYGPGRGEQWTEIHIVFDGPIFELWESSGFLDPKRPVHHAEPIEYWLQRLESTLGAPRKPGFAPPLLEVCRFQLVLGEMLLGGTRGRGQQKDMEWVSRACALLESDLERDLDLHDLAKTMGTSFDGFRKRFAGIVGIPPARYRVTRMIDRACELMQHGSLTD